MRTISTIADLREALAEHRRAGRSIGLVPTMTRMATQRTMRMDFIIATSLLLPRRI